MLKERDRFIGLQNIDVFRFAESLYQLLFLRSNYWPLRRAVIGWDPSEPMVRSAVLCLGGPNKRLGGNASDVDAGSAKHAGFDERHSRSQISAFYCSGETGRSPANYGEIESLVRSL
jgi:hypothetical protein